MGEAKRRGTRDERVAEIWTTHGVAPISAERYNAYVAWTRSPIIASIGDEVEFYANSAETLIGVLILDLTDRDYGYVILGRDEKGRFRAVDVKASMTRATARKELFSSIASLGGNGETVFPQGDDDIDKAGVDLFNQQVDDGKLHPSFKLLQRHHNWLPARTIMSEMMRHFTDIDGNFVEQFQTTAFDSRIWELYLYAALLELGLFVERPATAPDFVVSDGRRRVFLEAVTVGASPNDAPPPEAPESAPFDRTRDEVVELLRTKIPIRFGSALYSKLNRKNPYWELEHVKNYPLVFAIADFHERHSMTWTGPGLIEYLYGITQEVAVDGNGQLIIKPLKLETHEFQGKTIPSGYFFQPNAEHVSAVLFSSSGTIAKFNRMGRIAGFGLPNHRMVRMGIRYDHSPNATLPIGFKHDVGPGLTRESWAEGLAMFHNPRALRPVDPDLFSGIAHHFFEDGQLPSSLPEFHPYGSFTWSVWDTDTPA